MIGYEHITADAGRGTEIARLYLSAPLWDDAAQEAYDAFVSETVRQWTELSRRLHLTVQADDPYGILGVDGTFAVAESYAALRSAVDGGSLAVLATASTGGHPYMSDQVNDMFRAVHDYHGHYMTGRDFTLDGEEAAWTRHSRMYSPLARRAMTTETRGQNSALCWILGDFPVQKFVLLPEWVSEH